MSNVFSNAIDYFKVDLEDSLAFYAFPQLHVRKISSTSTLECLNREIRRQINMIGIFPNPKAYTKLVATYLMKYAVDWSSSIAYLSEQSIQAFPVCQLNF